MSSIAWNIPEAQENMDRDLFLLDDHQRIAAHLCDFMSAELGINLAEDQLEKLYGEILMALHNLKSE